MQEICCQSWTIREYQSLKQLTIHGEYFSNSLDRDKIRIILLSFELRSERFRNAESGHWKCIHHLFSVQTTNYLFIFYITRQIHWKWSGRPKLPMNIIKFGTDHIKSFNFRSIHYIVFLKWELLMLFAVE